METETELKVRLQTEEILTGVGINQNNEDIDLLPITQVNPSHATNLARHRSSLRSELSEIGEETTFRPVPSKVRD